MENYTIRIADEIMDRISELDMLEQLEEAIGSCSMEDFLDLYNNIFGKDLTKEDVIWGDLRKNV
jgi:hypothetical protein